MLTMSGGKILGNLPRAPDSDSPDSTAVRTWARVAESVLLLDCSDRIAKERSNDNPLSIIVANCRAITARSFSPTEPENPLNVMSRFMPVPDSFTVTGT